VSNEFIQQWAKCDMKELLLFTETVFKNGILRNW